MKLRLLLLEKCNRTCKGCCNKDFDLVALPECKSFAGFSEIILTGGEPLLVPDVIDKTVKQVRSETTAPIYLYTAWREDAQLLLDVLTKIDGMTLTLHTRKDTEPFVKFAQMVKDAGLLGKRSLRLNVFNGVSTGGADLEGWNVHRGIRWIKDCPLPTDEVFMRLKDACNA